MLKTSQLILPPQALASCIAGCILRDTRYVTLSDTDRINYFPASPLFTATLTLQGDIHLSDDVLGVEHMRHLPKADKRLFAAPKNTPHASWNPGPLLATTIAFFPDAWQRLGGAQDGTPPKGLIDALTVLESRPLETAWPEFWRAVTKLWTASQGIDQLTDWTGSHRLRDWSFHIFGQLAQTHPGRSLRSAQRLLLRWTGHNKKSLEFFARVEEVHRLSVTHPNTSPAELAIEAGFADQSHMGRVLKRATGFSPVQLNQRISTDESFWCYRLLGARF